MSLFLATPKYLPSLHFKYRVSLKRKIKFDSTFAKTRKPISKQLISRGKKGKFIRKNKEIFLRQLAIFEKRIKGGSRFIFSKDKNFDILRRKKHTLVRREKVWYAAAQHRLRGYLKRYKPGISHGAKFTNYKYGVKAFYKGKRSFGAGSFLKKSYNAHFKKAILNYFWRKLFLPVKRKSQHTRVLSSFNKIFQKKFWPEFERSFLPFNRSILALIKNKLKKRSVPRKVAPSFTTLYNFFPFRSNELLFLCKNLWPNSDVSFCVDLIKTGFFRVSEVPTYNPMSLIFPKFLGRIAMNPMIYLFNSLLAFRLSSNWSQSQNFLAKFKPFFSFSFMEFNYKTGEFLILNNAFKSFFVRPYLYTKVQAYELLLQRYFSRQKKFGTGRNVN